MGRLRASWEAAALLLDAEPPDALRGLAAALLRERAAELDAAIREDALSGRLSFFTEADLRLLAEEAGY